MLFSVHQCLFCPQTFDSVTAKDDHILEHFAQKTCGECDQKLIRIGGRLYTLHDTVTCIKRESKAECFPCASVAKERSLMPDERHLQSDGVDNEDELAADVIGSTSMRTEEIEIKAEPSDADYGQQLDNPLLENNIDVPENAEMDDFDEIMSDLDDVFELEKKLHIMQSKIDNHCKICNKRMSSWNSLRKHIKWNHDPNFKKPDQKKLAKCDICHREFYHRRNLNKHIEAVHGIDVTSLLTSVATKKSVWPKHGDPSKVTTHLCNICHKFMASSNSLRSHMQWNHDPNFKKPDQSTQAKCVICNREFFHKSNLKRHERDVHGIFKE